MKNQKNFQNNFTGKKIAIVGLGPHGEMIADIKFLIRSGAHVSLYDMRSERRMQGFLPTLVEAGLTEMKFGAVSDDELATQQLIILSPEVSRRSVFLKKARMAAIAIEYPDILFLKLAPAITLIGVMGACGKSTVAHLLYGMLKQAFSDYDNQGLYYIDPDLPNGALTHLKKIKAGDVILARIPEDMMNEYHAAHISPHVAVITSLTSAALQGNARAFSILEYQTGNNFVVAPDVVVDGIKDHADFSMKGKILRTKHENAALAIQAAELFKVPAEAYQKTVSEFTGLKGHRELVKKINGVEFYNDAASITPVSTLFALKNLSITKNIVLIFGGAYTSYDYGELIKKLSEYVSTVVLLPGSGTLGFRHEVEKLKDIQYFQAPSLEEAVIIAHGVSRKGDRILFSPGCEAIGLYISRRERGEKFVKAVKGL